MPDDLDALTTRLRSDPRDPVTIQALADWLEERGAAPESVRALTVDGPTVLIVGTPPEFNRERTRAVANEAQLVARWLSEHTGHPVIAMAMSSNMTIRAIRAEVKRDS